MNVSFDDIELSSLGLSIRTLKARSMASSATDKIVLSNGRFGDASVPAPDPGSTELDGVISADTDDWNLYTYDNWKARLREVKKAVALKKGFRKLVLTGDSPDRFRWCRYESLNLTETGPGLFTRPFFPATLIFDNLEPYWRETQPEVSISTPGVVPNPGDEDTRPTITVNIAQDIVAHASAITQPVSLFQIDDFQVNWQGTTVDGTLYAGDTLILDSETLTCRRVRAGETEEQDVIRYYGFAGPDSLEGDGFPVIKADGSSLSSIHYRVGSISFNYDALYN